MESWETDRSRDVLERIVALLFSLADMADRAAGLSFLHHRHVLGILSHGEVEARAFLIGADAPTLADAWKHADDASRLAARLRALALLLIALLAQATLFALPGAAGPRAGRRKPAGIAGRPASLSAPDTS